MRVTIAVLSAAVTMTLAGCRMERPNCLADVGAAPPRGTGPVRGEEGVTSALTATGASATVARVEDEGSQSAASVVRLDAFVDQDAKLFGTAGGDPAANGLYTYFAVFAGPAEGWQVFRLGDFEDYRVLRATRGRIDLEIRSSLVDPISGDVTTATRRAILTFTPPVEGGAAATVALAPAG